MLKLTRIVLLVAVAATAHAQEVRATMGGRVTDAQGGLVPGATVVVVSEDSDVKQQTNTNPQGNWILQFLLPGHYRFTVTSAGFKALDRSGITLQAGDN